MGNWQMNKASIIVDASKYIEELKQKVEGMNSELGNVESSTTQMDEQPMVVLYFSISLLLYITWSTSCTLFLY
jgi:hypothetical protein